MDHLEFSRNDGLYTPLTVIDNDGNGLNMTGMDFRGVIEWYGGSMEITEANGRLVADDRSQGEWIISLSDADAESLSSNAAFLTMRDETPGAELTYVERLAVKVK